MLPHQLPIPISTYVTNGRVGSFLPAGAVAAAGPPRVGENLFPSEGMEILNTRWAPCVDVRENGEEIVVEADVPGVDEKSITVNIEEGRLTICGERRFSNRTEDEEYHRMERVHGAFRRSFMLPGSVDASKIAAQHKDGVLTVYIPKRNGGKPRGLEVKVA